MKVLLINGSPHEKGCTYTALEEVASALQANGVETEIFWIGNKPIGGCIGCGACFREKKGCVFGAEDGVNECTAKIKEADGVVVGSPVHFASAGGNICAFLDRVFYQVRLRGQARRICGQLPPRRKQRCLRPSQ